MRIDVTITVTRPIYHVTVNGNALPPSHLYHCTLDGDSVTVPLSVATEAAHGKIGAAVVRRIAEYIELYPDHYDLTANCVTIPGSTLVMIYVGKRSE